MRIPWYIYVPLCLIVPCVTLYICVKDNDIVTPPSPEEIHNATDLWKAGYPISEETVSKVRYGNNDAPKPAPSPPEPNGQDSVNPVPVIDISEIKLAEVSPALDGLTKQKLTTAQLMKYGELAMSNNQVQPARIAFERVIDTAEDASAEDKKIAASHIRTLSSQAPLWNPDPTSRRTLPIHLSINEDFKDQFERIIKQLETISLNASDGTVIAAVSLAAIKKDIGNPSNALPAQSSLRISADTPLVTFSIKEVTDLDTKILAALYYAIRSKNNQTQNLITVPERPIDISSLDALNSYITRLAWVNATSPQPKANPSPTEDPE